LFLDLNIVSPQSFISHIHSHFFKFASPHTKR
jgi:hypothetical protein